MGKLQNSKRERGKGQREDLCRNGACPVALTAAVHLVFSEHFQTGELRRTFPGKLCDVLRVEIITMKQK